MKCGYTWNFKLYCGKEQTDGISVPRSRDSELSDKLLMPGRTAVTDNYYASLKQANKLFAHCLLARYNEIK